MKCIFCGAWEFGKSQAYISYDEAVAALDAGKKEGYRITTLTGGEPTLNSDYEKIIRYAHSIGYWTVVTTNGLFLTDEMIHTYKNCKTLVRVSLHTLNAPLHKEITGENTLHTVLQNIQRLRENGVRLGIGCTIYDKNIDELHSLASFAWKSNAAFIRYTPVVGIRGADSIKLEYSFFRDLLGRIAEICVNNSSLLEQKSYNSNYAKQIVDYMTTRRCAGGSKQHIIYDCHGTVLPCSFIPEEMKLCCESENTPIRERFKKVNENMSVFFSDAFTENLMGECGKCIHKKSCRGGCLTMKLPLGLPPDGEQPICIHHIISEIYNSYEEESMRKLINYWCSCFLQKAGAADRDKVCIRRLPIWELNFRYTAGREKYDFK